MIKHIFRKHFRALPVFRCVVCFFRLSSCCCFLGPTGFVARVSKRFWACLKTTQAFQDTGECESRTSGQNCDAAEVFLLFTWIFKCIRFIVFILVYLFILCFQGNPNPVLLLFCCILHSFSQIIPCCGFCLPSSDV